MDWHHDPELAEELANLEPDDVDETAEEQRAREFKEKLRYINFPGRGKASRARQIHAHGKAVSDADRERRS